MLPDTGSGPFDGSQGGMVGLFALLTLAMLGILFLRSFKRSQGQ
jgi:hypothetical protein